jgi:hypothetical protein
MTSTLIIFYIIDNQSLLKTTKSNNLYKMKMYSERKLTILAIN